MDENAQTSTGNSVPKIIIHSKGKSVFYTHDKEVKLKKAEVVRQSYTLNCLSNELYSLRNTSNALTLTVITRLSLPLQREKISHPLAPIDPSCIQSSVVGLYLSIVTEMASLQGPVVCPMMRAKQTGLCIPVNSTLLKAKLVRSEFLGLKGLSRGRTKVGQGQHLRKCRTIQCSFSSSSDGNGSMAGNSNENDADYVNSSVVEAVEVRSGADGFVIKMRDGRHLRCVHNNPQGGHLPDYAPHPAIVLKMEDGTGLLLPIIVLEMPSVLLMAAVRNVQIARPTIYQVVKDMIEKMGYTVKHVRVTKRVHEAYFAELHMVKLDNEAECVSFDLRPSDAINIAVRCKVPIQVNKFLAYSDGMRVVESAKVSMQSCSPGAMLFTELDRPTGEPCIETKEFDLVRNMLVAAVEERYRDAALWRDKLTQLRSKRNWT